MELSEAQASIMEDEGKGKLDRVRKPGKYSSSKGDKSNEQKKEKDSNKVCYSCGESFPHKGGKKACPAAGSKCTNCGKDNHFAKMCRSKKTNAIEESGSSDSDDDYLFNLQRVQRKKEKGDLNKVESEKVKTKTIVGINGVPTEMQIDSGADVNTVTEDDYKKVKNKVTLVPTRARLFPYQSNKPLELLGKFTASVSSKNCYVADFYVVKGTTSGALLGVSTAIALKVLKIMNQVSTEEKGKVKRVLNNNKNET
jgi:hypothetical protein